MVNSLVVLDDRTTANCEHWNKLFLDHCRVDKEDEMECLIRGCNFLLRNISNEVFEFHREQNPPYVFQDLDHSELFPYLLVNIGSGVSIVKVNITM